MGALRDCEAIVDAFWGQPANSATALAFVIGGLIVIVRSELTWVGIASIATGLGSFLFHGPMPPLSEWVHDLTLAWLLLVIAGVGRPWEKWTRLPGLAAVAAICAIPGAADPFAGVLAVVAVVLVVVADRSARTIGPMVLLGVAAVLGRLGATGGPLCDPDAIFQPHAVWHLSAATAVTWWALARPRRAG
jgi:hypothetical protein